MLSSLYSEFSMATCLPEPTVKNLLESKSLRWIFVGGKGGVGKTTCSCCIATLLSKVRERVLILSTDPAHNLSDAFDQKFSRTPTKVKDYDNLYAMEIDPNVNLDELEGDLVGTEEANISAHIRRGLTHLMASFPGVDEYMSYVEVFRLVQNLDYSVVVFDTAPTGHTLRLLAFPENMEKSLTQFVAMKNEVGPLLRNLMGFLGMQDTPMGDLTAALENRLPVVKEITRQFKDPSQTTFVCVCIPEFLSMYETERLVQELTAQEIDVHNVIVNQLLFPNMITPGSESNRQSCNHASKEAASQPPTSCRMCIARHRIQSKYLEQIIELYEDMHVIQLPQMEEEVRGVASVQAFSQYLIQPFRR